MILELGDGRELCLPDEMPDETARQLKALILATEGRARAAESETRLLRDEMAALRQSFSAVSQKADAANSTAQAVAEASRAIVAALARVERAALADRRMMPDEFGEYTMSKAVLNGR